MKIAIISPGAFSVPPVIGSSVEHDIQMVAEQLSKEHRVTVYARKCREYRRSKKRGNLHYKRFSYRSPRGYLKKVVSHLKKHKPDIVMVENRPAYVLYIKKKLPRLPIVLNMHSTVFASPPAIKRSAMHQVSRKSDALITNSKYLKKWYTRHFPQFKKKAHGVHLGIDSEPYEKAKNKDKKIRKLKKKLKIKGKNQTILFVGRIMKEKGIHLVLDIMPKLIKKYPKVKLVITGASRYGRNIRTPYVRRIYRKASRLGKHVVFTGFIRPHKIPYIYQLADVVVIPSLWHEPFGRVNLEAMSSQKVVLASKRGGIPEVIRHEKDGLIVKTHKKKKLYKALSKLLASEELRQELGKNGWERSKEFTWEKTTERYLEIFESLVRKKKESR